MNRKRVGWIPGGLLAVALVVTGIGMAPAAARAAATATTATAVASADSGLAAVYNPKLNGHKTASGERYDKTALTTAHRTLPFGTKVKVTRVDNGKSVVVKVNDRGPKQPDRVVDLSSAAAKAIGLSGSRMTPVKLEVVEAAAASAPAPAKAGGKAPTSKSRASTTH